MNRVREDMSLFFVLNERAVDLIKMSQMKGLSIKEFSYLYQDLYKQRLSYR